RAVREVATAALLARHWPAKGTRQDAFLALAGGLLRAGLGLERTERFVGALAAATQDEEAPKRAQAVALTPARPDEGGKATGWPGLQELIGADGQEVLRRARAWLGLGPAPAAASGATKARRLAPYRPFPVDALPAPLAEYVRQGALALGCDPAFL